MVSLPGSGLRIEDLRDLVPHVLQVEPRHPVGGLRNRGANLRIEILELTANQRARIRWRAGRTGAAPTTAATRRCRRRRRVRRIQLRVHDVEVRTLEIATVDIDVAASFGQLGP